MASNYTAISDSPWTRVTSYLQVKATGHQDIAGVPLTDLPIGNGRVSVQAKAWLKKRDYMLNFKDGHPNAVCRKDDIGTPKEKWFTEETDRYYVGTHVLGREGIMLTWVDKVKCHTGDTGRDLLMYIKPQCNRINSK